MVQKSGRPDEASFPACPVRLDGSAENGYPRELDARSDAPMAPPTSHQLYDWQVPPTPRPAPVVEPAPDAIEAERLAARDVWRVFPSDKPAGGELEVLSTDWFKYLESKRYRRHGQWIPTFLEFGKHADQSLLAVGDGLGFEWVRFAEGGAHVTIVDPSAERLRLYRTHFSARAVSGQFVQAPLDHLPSPDSRIDVACAIFNEPPVVPWATALAEA